MPQKLYTAQDMGSSVAVSNYSTNFLALTPLGYWKLNEANGSGPCADSSGNSYNLTYGGSNTYGVPGLLTGETDTCVKANSVGIASGAVNLVNDVFTLVVWIKPAVVSGYQGIISQDNGGAYLRLSSTGTIQCLKSEVQGICDSGATTLSVGSTYMVVWTKNGATNHLYVNGVDVTSNVTNAACVAGGNLSIGSDVHGNYELGTLTVEKAGVLNYALTPAQVSSLYTAGTTTSTPRLTIVNSPNPTNLQDVATKAYVDDYHLRFGLYETLWETEYSMPCSSATFGNGYTHLTTGPIDQTITKLYPETAILVTGHMTFYINVSSAQIKLVCGINGQPGVEICGLAAGAQNEHTAFPVGIRYYWGGAGQYLGTATGVMTVAWFMYVSNTTTTVYTDPNDAAAWTMAECKGG